MRRWRRGTRRYRTEQERIEHWLEHVRDAAGTDPAAAAELVQCQRLIKGYGDTFERGLARFNRIMDAWASIKSGSDAASTLGCLREAAIADEEGTALSSAITDPRHASRWHPAIRNATETDER